MELFFQIGLTWFMLTYTSVFTYTKSYGHLVAATGAALILSGYLLLEKPALAVTMAGIGKVLFFVGIAMLTIFRGGLERERLQRSSWKEILLGKVPNHLQTNKLSQKEQIVLAISLSLLFVLIFYLAGHVLLVMALLLISVLFTGYLLVK